MLRKRLSQLLFVVFLAPCVHPAAALQHLTGLPPGQLIDIGGFRLHLDCRGAGDTPIVIDAGGGAWSIFFSHVQDSLVSEGMRVCTYDRAGLGWSDPGPPPRSSDRMADELYRLLMAAGEQPPYILVGHSLGGLNVRLFAAQHPQLVAGLVLAEAAHEDQWARLPAEAWLAVEAAIPRLEAAAAAARAGKITASSVSPDAFPTVAPERVETYVTAMTTPKPYEGFLAELRALRRSHSVVGERAASLGNLPIAVVSAGNSFASFGDLGIPVDLANRVWAELQLELVQLSSRSRHFISETATHRLQFTDPHAIMDGVRHVVGVAARESRSADLRTEFSVLPREFRVLPNRVPPFIDELLSAVEAAYVSMDVDGFVGLFSDDFVQLGINRRVRVTGREAWRAQTVAVNGAHRSMGRRHFGRIWSDPWLIVEIEWWGTVRGEAIGTPGQDADYRYSGVGLLEIRDGRIRRQILWDDFLTLVEHLPSLGRERETRR